MNYLNSFFLSFFLVYSIALCQEFESYKHPSSLKKLGNIVVQEGRLKRFRDGVYEDKWVEISSARKKRWVKYVESDNIDTVYILRSPSIAMIQLNVPIHSSQGDRSEKRFIIINVNTFRILFDNSFTLYQNAGSGDIRISENSEVKFLIKSNLNLHISYKHIDNITKLSYSTQMVLIPNLAIGGVYCMNKDYILKLYKLTPIYVRGRWQNEPKLVDKNINLFCYKFPLAEQSKTMYYYKGEIYSAREVNNDPNKICLYRPEDYRFY